MDEYRDILTKEWKRLWRKFKESDYKRSTIGKNTTNEELEWFIDAMEGELDKGLKVAMSMKSLPMNKMLKVSHLKFNIKERKLEEYIDIDMKKTIESVKRLVAESYYYNPFSGSSTYNQKDLEFY